MEHLSPEFNQSMEDQLALRPPDEVMRLERMGSFFPTRLSFLRSLLRKLAEDDVGVKRPIFELDEAGYGHAVYEVQLDGAVYSLIAFSEALDAEHRTDRVIAEAWDACFVLFDGRPDEADIQRLHGHATKQEAGCYDERVLVLSRANKSVRLFDHVVERLSQGQQPDAEMIGRIGYLMRTTAVYGNGKFGMADRAEFLDRPSLSQPFRLEMLTVYLIREFTLDLINHVASAVSIAHDTSFTELADRFRKQLGIGNSTGLGMAPFLVGHPVLINNWMLVRETALARVRALPEADEATRQAFAALLDQAGAHLQEWQVDDQFEQARIDQLRIDFSAIRSRFLTLIQDENPWNAIVMASQSGTSSLQELTVALVLEPHGEVIDGLCDCMEDTNGLLFDPVMSVGACQSIIDAHYGWALGLDLTQEQENAMIWYVSEEKLEPRLGERQVDSEERREMPHNIAHKVQNLQRCMGFYDREDLMAELLLAHPQHRDIVRRIQTIDHHPYGEIRDNLVARGIRPIDLLRCKLSFFGASKFDPRSDRWTRITLYQGAPTARDLGPENAADVFLPAFAHG